MEEQLLFLIGPPRSGSTMLAHMLGSHADVFAPQEPHLLTPLAHLGYYESVRVSSVEPERGEPITNSSRSCNGRPQLSKPPVAATRPYQRPDSLRVRSPVAKSTQVRPKRCW